MPAPPVCRDCGAALSPDLGWCGRCLKPVRGLAPRPKFEGGSAGPLRHDVRYSRWRGGPTTFGPFGRIVGTGVLLLFGPWGSVSAFTFLYTPAWLILCVLALRHIWSRVPVQTQTPDGLAARHPLLSRRFEGRGFALAALVIGLAGYAAAVVRLGTGGRFVLLAVTACVALGLLFTWLADI